MRGFYLNNNVVFYFKDYNNVIHLMINFICVNIVEFISENLRS